MISEQAVISSGRATNALRYHADAPDPKHPRDQQLTSLRHVSLGLTTGEPGS